MPAHCRWLPVAVLIVLAAGTVCAAAPSACETMQARITAVRAAVKIVASKKDAAKLQAELDRLSAQYAARCGQQEARKPAGPAPKNVRPVPPPAQPLADTPEEEIKHRRDAINTKRPAGDKPGLPRAATGGRTISVSRAIPVEGTIVIESGASSSFYGKIKQEIAYTIQEFFVGNLIVTRHDDRATGQSTGREDYALQTISTEISVESFKGRGCAKHSGSPPVCTQWHRIDLWQIADGEEYPGRSDGVVSASSDGRSVTIRVDGPDIDFGSSQGPVSIRSGCGDQFRETVSRDEFKQWLHRRAVRIKREMGKIAPGCSPGSTLTLEMHIGQEP